MGDFKLETGGFCPWGIWSYGGFSPGGLYPVGFYPGGFCAGGFSPTPSWTLNCFTKIFSINSTLKAKLKIYDWEPVWSMAKHFYT